MNDRSIPAPTPVSLALVTGGSRGLGREMALQLAARGIDIILTYRSQAAAAAEVVAAIRGQGRRAVALPLAVGQGASLDAFVPALREALHEHWRREHVDALVNNGGNGVHASIATTTEAQFAQMLAVHLTGPFFLTQRLLPLLADGGRILNVSSGLTRFSLPGYAAYAAAKGGVEVLTRYLAVELGSRGITVNTLAPGAIATDFGGGAVRDNPTLAAMIAGQTALGRVGQAPDIGGAVAWLLAPESRWINGQRIEASGGIHL
ncbi:MAG: SDR family oxidoreductase [Nannocystaceae bacterium]|nr:SDR family oxidoreductase [Nannocystaceae bacterium]